MEYPQVKTSYPILGRIAQILNEAPWYGDVQWSTIKAHKIFSLAVQRGEEPAAFHGRFTHREEPQPQWDGEGGAKQAIPPAAVGNRKVCCLYQFLSPQGHSRYVTTLMPSCIEIKEISSVYVKKAALLTAPTRHKMIKMVRGGWSLTQFLQGIK